jgi:hypothetical protein
MGWDDASYYEDEISHDEFVAETLKNISQEGVRTYLGVHGDAVDFRVKDCIEQARNLNAYGFHRQAILSSTIAIELIVRFLLVRPLIQAADEDWAYLLTQRITSGPSIQDRNLLPEILHYHDIKISDVETLYRCRAIWRCRREHFARSAQDQWRFCDQCNAMFFDGYPTKGLCPAGAGHQSQGFMFVLPHIAAG